MTDEVWINIDNLDGLIIDNEWYDKQIDELNKQKITVIENYNINVACLGQELYEHLTIENDLKLLIIAQIIHLFNTLKNE